MGISPPTITTSPEWPLAARRAHEWRPDPNAHENRPKPAEAPTAALVNDLCRAVLKALTAGNGRSNRCEVGSELPLRINGVVFDPELLALALVRLEDVGLIQRVQRQPYGAYPQSIVGSGLGRYDDTDVLAADIADVLKRHGEEFDNEDELQGWLDEDGIAYTERSLAMALAQLEQIRRIKRLRQDDWTPDRSLPGYWIPPKIFSER